MELLEHILHVVENSIALNVFVWYVYGFLTSLVVLTFVRGIGGLEVAFEDFTSSLIWPLALVSLFGLFVRGVYLTYKEHEKKDNTQ